MEIFERMKCEKVIKVSQIFVVSEAVSEISFLWAEHFLGGGFKYVYFHPYLGKLSNLIHIFQMG